MKILFIHGLESTLNEPKKSVLEKYGEVLAPILDYKNNINIYSLLESIIEENKVDVIIGSSIGGFIGYHLNKNLNKPALLFNPALPYQSVKQIITTKNEVIQKSLKYIVLGRFDKVIKFEANLDFLIKNTANDEKLEIKIINQLEHRIPLETFKQEIFSFCPILNNVKKPLKILMKKLIVKYSKEKPNEII